MKNYNKIYRNFVYEHVQKYIKNGFTEVEAISNCSRELYEIFMKSNTFSEVFKGNSELKPNESKVQEMLIVSTLYIDFIRFMNTQIKEDKNLPVIFKTYYFLMKNCKSYDEIFKLFQKTYDLFHIAVDCVYEIEEKYAFLKIMYSGNLSDEENKRILSIFPNYQDDLDQYIFIIDKDYIINKINQMSNHNVDFQIILNDLMVFIPWLKDKNPNLYNELINDMNNDIKLFIDKINETLGADDFYVKTFSDKANLAVDKLTDENLDNLSYGITAFTCMETNYSNKYFDEGVKYEK